ncbi:MAG TPA: hypothetical protein VEP90_06240 [Methylomirabilota bacterium]|nr:hypothetical protein [Methylomirabilota bacterium]
MTFDKKNLHMVPQILQDRAQTMLNENNFGVAENVAMQLEVVIEFCEAAVQQYDKKRSKMQDKRVKASS